MVCQPARAGAAPVHGQDRISPPARQPDPRDVFAFKIIEYLAARRPRHYHADGRARRELEAGHLSPEPIAASDRRDQIRRIVETRGYEQTATAAAQESYGPSAVLEVVGRAVERVVASSPPDRVAQARNDEPRATEISRSILGVSWCWPAYR